MRSGTQTLEDHFDVGAGEPAIVANGEAVIGHGCVEFVLGLLQEALPHVEWDDDALGSTVRAEVHRFAISGIEALGDPMQGLSGLPGGDNFGHGSKGT